jgi:serine/threonine protein kinase
MKTQPQRICPNCGNAFSGAIESCPVCLLRTGLPGGVESGESSSGDILKPIPAEPAQRFDHYELVTSEDGKPVELGRGAMGVTYKAFDVNLRCPVTLKVISERYLGDESMRLRFLREARAAAKVRHANVASVLHLGVSGENCFYAMEFVEGETLENLVRRSGRLEVKLAMEITTQVATGLAAVHKQKLVHRDIKPSNIIVNIEQGGAVTAKIIDLGLAKSLAELSAQTAISTPGAFVGTPEFASPEQFAGLGVDIRSDLYSLGVTLWEMLMGNDWRQGRWERSIAALEKSASLDPRNPELLELLAEDYLSRRRYRDSEQIRDRQIALQPDQPLFCVMKADTAFAEKADVNGARAVYEALPSSVKNDIWITMQRAFYAMCDRDWRTAEEIVNNSPNEEIGFSGAVVPRRVANIWLELVRGNYPTMEKFGATRELLCRKVEADRTNPMLLSVLACVDVALGRKEEAIREARSALESRPISEDALDGTFLVFNLAMVYAWANEPDLAFEQLVTLINTPNRLLTYGSLKVDPTWDHLRKNPRFEKLLARLAPNQSSWKPPSSPARTHKPSVRSAPKKISLARLPITGSDVFGREEDIDFLDCSWANRQIYIVSIVAWAGVGKSTLVNHWLRRMAADHYRSAELIFGWSFYRQGTSRETSSADEFLDAALAWFGDPDPRLGTGWEKGERLAKLVAHRRTLLILDGLEPLQNPPGSQEGRLREPSLQALLRELAASNKGLCLITTRLPVADLADYAGISAIRRDLEQLPSDAGAKLLRALGVREDEAELRRASDEFSGHCLALTLLGSYLTDAFDGDIRFRKEVSGRLAHDVRQGVHARKVLECYQTWFGEGPELSVLQMLGLFDRPTDKKALGALLKPPAIPGLTDLRSADSAGGCLLCS